MKFVDDIAMMGLISKEGILDYGRREGTHSTVTTLLQSQAVKFVYSLIFPEVPVASTDEILGVVGQR